MNRGALLALGAFLCSWSAATQRKPRLRSKVVLDEASRASRVVASDPVRSTSMTLSDSDETALESPIRSRASHGLLRAYAQLGHQLSEGPNRDE